MQSGSQQSHKDRNSNYLFKYYTDYKGLTAFAFVQYAAIICKFEGRIFRMKDKPNIGTHLLWEYDLDTFHWDRSWKIVIERVIQRGDLHEWREIYRFYGPEKILATVDWSKQLDKRDKDFTRFFINSDLLHVA